METLTLINILFGVFNDNEDFAILNQLILIAKFFIYKWKLNKAKPTLRVFFKIKDQISLSHGEKNFLKK